MVESYSYGNNQTYQDEEAIASAKRHIKEIRTKKYSIGKKEANPLTLDLHHAVTSLSAELYQKDIHFLMELIQNAEDNEYEEGVEPTLEFVMTKKDITGSGAPATLLVFNNEVGFSRKNMDSICSVGRSTKKGKRQRGFIGEKGIGFKSVFLVSSQPWIFSNGYRVRFTEEPNQYCGIRYVVPEFVTRRPYLSRICNAYGSNKILPTTIFVLPLKPDKVEAVRAQLSDLHPEILLFFSKIK
ncbi:protein NO VEIN-like [Pyrus communis]|uniref:protein NO VEIN-like n=1 Tax=Pyrus communis TaxID=23211 RepID=UPI0035BF137F